MRPRPAWATAVGFEQRISASAPMRRRKPAAGDFCVLTAESPEVYSLATFELQSSNVSIGNDYRSAGWQRQGKNTTLLWHPHAPRRPRRTKVEQAKIRARYAARHLAGERLLGL